MPNFLIYYLGFWSGLDPNPVPDRDLDRHPKGMSDLDPDRYQQDADPDTGPIT
jgi:hypothetical protein